MTQFTSGGVPLERIAAVFESESAEYARRHPRSIERTGRGIAGFYDGVPEPPAELVAQWATLGFDDKAFLGAVGLSVPAGERGRSVLEQTWSRPTCEINGMGGGYQGEGFKTVIPAVASAKVSFRLVFDQDPHKVREAFRAHVAARLPADCRLRHGIYAVRFRRPNGALHDGVSSFGRRPTFDDGPPLLETFVFDFKGSLYGEIAEVSFLAWIRPELRFDSVDALIAQMARDVEQARAALAAAAPDSPTDRLLALRF